VASELIENRCNTPFKELLLRKCVNLTLVVYSCIIGISWNPLSKGVITPWVKAFGVGLKYTRIVKANLHPNSRYTLAYNPEGVHQITSVRT
jgi:hypothetical protein